MQGKRKWSGPNGWNLYVKDNTPKLQAGGGKKKKKLDFKALSAGYKALDAPTRKAYEAAAKQIRNSSDPRGRYKEWRGLTR